MKKDKIYIAICARSLNHNFLKLLNCIHQNWITSNLSIKVLITFNSPNMINNSQHNLIKKNLKQIDFKIIYEKKIGISNARNKCLKSLKSLNFDYCCFLDDDCIINKKFITNHLSFIKKNYCNIVGGPQFYKSKNAFFKVFERNFHNGKEVFWVSTNNVFFKKQILNNNIYFSKKVTKYGFGEDQLFFSKQSKVGEIIKWNNNPVFEIVQKKRENFYWFMLRNYKYGLTGILIDREIYSYYLAFILNIFKASLNLTKCFLYLLLIPIKPISSFYQSLAFFFRFAGRVVKIVKFK